jgi:hypothetical protein
MTNKVGVSGDEFMLFNPNPCLFKMQINSVKMLMYLVLNCMLGVKDEWYDHFIQN